MVDVFVSYRHKDAPAVASLADALAARGLSVWLDRDRIEDFASITRSIEVGLAGAKALLAWFSPDYPKSRACQWELTTAFLAAQAEGDPLRRILVANTEATATHIHPVELRDQLHRAALQDAGPGALEGLADAVAKHVASLDGVFGGLAAQPLPPWHGARPVSSTRFVGRLPDLWRVHSSLHAAERTIITGRFAGACALLCGLGGSGKSLLAEEYAMRFGRAFPGGVFWLRALGDPGEHPIAPEAREAARQDQLRGFAAEVDAASTTVPPQEVESWLHRELARRAQPFLWVVDDVPAGMPVDTLRRWLAPAANGKTLITTRSREYAGFGDSLALGGLEPADAFELLTARAVPADAAERQAAEAITEALGHHALAVDVAGAALAAPAGPQPFAAFLDALRQPSDDELEFASELAGQLPNGHEASVAATLLRSIRQLGEEGRDLLLLASSLAVDPIPLDLAREVMTGAEPGEKVGDATAGRRRTQRAVHQVSRLSLAEVAEDGGGALAVHRLVSRAMRYGVAERDRRAALRALAIPAVSARLTDVEDVRTHSRLDPWVRHARQLVGAVPAEDTLRLGLQVARYDFECQAYAAARAGFEAARTAATRLYGEDDRQSLEALNGAALAANRLGDFATARALQEKAVALETRAHGPAHPDTLALRGNLAMTLQAQGDFDAALAIQKEVFEAEAELFGPDAPRTLTTLNNVAQTLHVKGDLADARELYKLVLERSVNALGPEHPDTLATQTNLAEVLLDLGDLTDAHAAATRVLGVREAQLGADHPNTLTPRHLLARVYMAGGYPAEARELFEKLLAARRALFGDTSESTIVTLNNIAMCHDLEGNRPAARAAYEQAIEAGTRGLGAEHPEVLTATANYAEVLYADGERGVSRKLQEQVLAARIRSLGASHPATLTSMNNYARTLFHDDEKALAADFARRALEARVRVIGPRHDDTTMTAFNLKVILESVGEYDAAAEVAREHLAWLFDADPASLLPQQRSVRSSLRPFGG